MKKKATEKQQLAFFAGGAKAEIIKSATLTPEAERLFANFEMLAEAPGGVKRLRELVRELAVRGKLVAQIADEEPAVELLTRLGVQNETNQRRSGELISFDGIPAHELPLSWRWARFTEVASIESNLVDPSDFGDMPHVAPDNIEKGTGRLLPYNTVREDQVISSKHRFYPGQILYSKIRPNLSKATIASFEGLCSADMYPLAARIDTAFLLLFMLSNVFLRQVVKADNRLAMPKVNQQQLSVTLISVPPLAEQARIVAKVDELMALCDEMEARQAKRRVVAGRLNKAALGELTSAEGPEELAASLQRVVGNFETLADGPAGVKQLRELILELAVRGQLVPQDPHDESADALLQRILAARATRAGSAVEVHAPIEGLPSLPSGWKWAPLDALLIHLRNGIATAPSGTVGTAILRISALRPNQVSIDDVRFLPGALSDYEDLVLKKGDLLFTRYSGNAHFVGICGVVPSMSRPTVYPDKLIRGIVSPGHLDERFVALAVNTGESRGYINTCARTTAGQVGISGKQLRRTPIPVPPFAEQRRIVAQTDRLMALCDTLEARLRAADDGARRLAESLVAELIA